MKNCRVYQEGNYGKYQRCSAESGRRSRHCVKSDQWQRICCRRYKKKIESAIRELEYTPNELARNLFKNRTGIIGVLVPDLDHPFFPLLQGKQRLLFIKQDIK